MELEKCFKRLLIKNPFYGLFALSLSKRESKAVPTLGVRKQGLGCELIINPDFWKEHTDDEQIALLTHELSHIALQHIFGTWDHLPNHKTVNVAMDMEVNSYIDNLPKDGCFASQLGLPNGKGTKFYYEALMQQQQQQQAQSPQLPCNGGQGGQSQDSQSPQPSQNSQEEKKEEGEGNTPQEQQEPQKQEYPEEILNKGFKPLDSHDSWKDFKDIPQATQQLIQNNINSIVKTTAEQIEKQCGTIPMELREIVEKLREKKPEIFNWKAYFRRMLGSIYDVNIKSTRRKQSKRFEGAAGIQHKKKVSILVAVDTSGSVSSKELQDFFSEIEYIYKAGARVTILECDARINKIVEYDGKMVPEIVGRGGTSFDPPVEYYIKHRKEYASIIYFTDGECSLPLKRPSGMVWVITSNGMHQDFPGKTIYIPKEQS